MRILHVIPFFAPAMGGSARAAYQTARHLGERGHSVTVVSSNYRIRDASFPAGPFEVVLLPAISRWGFYLTPGLARWATQNLDRFDVVHLHEIRTYQNAVIFRPAVRRKIPYVLSAHGTLPVIIQRHAAKQAYDRLAGRALLTFASCLVAVSPAEAEQYRDAGIEEKRIRVVFNGLDLAEFSQLPEQGSFRAQAGISPDAPLVLFLGRLHRIKGLDRLIAAFGVLRCSRPNAVLALAGPDAGDRARLEKIVSGARLQDRVVFTGPLYGASRLAALADADVFVSPSEYEIFGLSPFEALMCGTPVVVTQDTGAGRLIAEAGAGYLTPYGDDEALAGAICDALADPAEARRRVAAGQAFVHARLDWAGIAGELEALYAACIYSERAFPNASR